MPAPSAINHTEFFILFPKQQYTEFANKTDATVTLVIDTAWDHLGLYKPEFDFDGTVESEKGIATLYLAAHRLADVEGQSSSASDTGVTQGGGASAVRDPYSTTRYGRIFKTLITGRKIEFEEDFPPLLVVV